MKYCTYTYVEVFLHHNMLHGLILVAKPCNRRYSGISILYVVYCTYKAIYVATAVTQVIFILRTASYDDNLKISLDFDALPTSIIMY